MSVQLVKRRQGFVTDALLNPSLELDLDEVVDKLGLKPPVVPEHTLKLTLNLHPDLANALLFVDVIFVEHGAATALEDMESKLSELSFL